MGTALALALLIGLAAFRAWRFLAVDTLIDKWRHAYFRRFPPNNQYRQYDRIVQPDGKRGPWIITGKLVRPISKLGVLVDCPWCSSVWFAAAITAIVAQMYPTPLPVLVWAVACSVAGLAAMIDGEMRADG